MELLKLAARAADIEVWRGAGHQCDMLFRSAPSGDGKFGGVEWNPLTDDGDALRLVVKLGINLEIGEPGFGDVQAGKRDHWAVEWLSPDDPCAATRRAIVRAAAEIGKRVDAPQNAG